MNRALLLVDIQNDFCPGGALAVPDGDQVVAVANRESLSGNYDMVIASQDWHPQNHGSFASNHGMPVYSSILLGGLSQTLWPDHCVQKTRGAEFHPDLDLHGVLIIRKGTDPLIDSYSAFFDNGKKRSTGLDEILDRFYITELTALGLATDYCLKASAIDSANLGIRTRVLLEGCRGVNLKPSDVADAIEAMRAAGVSID